jgi:hypothetical protein
MPDFLDLKDISNRIKSDFGDNSEYAEKILLEAINNTDYLNHPRILRCILFLADGDLEKLKKNIDVAIYDPRDVMFWAEYTKPGENQTPKRIRDFNKSFEFCEFDVTE